MFDDYFKSFLGQSIRLAAICSLPCMVVLIFLARSQWILGLLAVLAWLAVNNYLLVVIMKAVETGDEKQKSRMMMMCMIKFPVLYLAGLALLFAPGIHAEGVLMGLTIYFVVFFALWRIKKPNLNREI